MMRNTFFLFSKKKKKTKMILILLFVIIVFLGLLFWYLRDYARAGGLTPVETGVC